MKDGVAITVADDKGTRYTGVNSSILCIESFSPKDEGCYHCVVRNETGSVASNSAILRGTYRQFYCHHMLILPTCSSNW